MDYDLSGKVIVITGAGNGIGAATSAMFASEGARVVVGDISYEAALAQADKIVARGGEALAVKVDVTDENSVKNMFLSSDSRWGRLDVLVNNAGFTRDMRITKMELNDWDSVVDVILKGAFLCTREAIPRMREVGSGRIVNVSSRAHLGNAGQANYSAAKAGIIGFTKAMALENGRFNICVNAVAPGIISTQAVLALPHFAKIKEAAEKTTPIPRIGEPDDVAAAITFLSSKYAAYITGDLLHVTGGRY